MATINKRAWTTKAGAQRVRWDAQVYVGRRADGRPHFLSKTFGRKAEAEAWSRKQGTLMDEGGKPATTKETLAEYLERWLGVYAGQVRDVTVYNYRTSLNKWILRPTNAAPPLGSIRLSKLTVAAFDQLYTYMHSEGLGPRGIEYVSGILKRALKDAVRKGELPRNPAEFATLPKPDRDGEREEEPVGCALTREEAERFLAAAREDPFYSALWHVLITGGLRTCEAFALKWSDVDLDQGEVKVSRTLSRMGLDRTKHPEGWKLTAPKTPKSRRVVALPDVTMRQLRAWKRTQAEWRLKLGPEWKDHGFVFTTEVGSPLDSSNLYRGPYRRVMERAGLGIWGPEPEKPKRGPTRQRPFTPKCRIYDLRHTHASLLLMDGEDLLVVSRRLGHSTIKLTADTYAHVTPERSEAAAKRFDRLFGTG